MILISMVGIAKSLVQVRRADGGDRTCHSEENLSHVADPGRESFQLVDKPRSQLASIDPLIVNRSSGPI
ncbi:MAG: hypothetical protein KatS3mg105_2542 [Gemmatales bacterium]|nr:MAG: hypothetical protein KatS3mg105_2542 [Gemmatales bacterium]